MEIRAYAAYDETQILSLYESVGWTAYTDRPHVLRKGIENSLLCLAAFEGDRLIGLIRAVGDGQTVVLIQDILVHPGYQRQGVGTRLMKCVLERFKDVRQVQLLTDDTPKTISFYESLGFQSADRFGCKAFLRG
ncbi:MAG: GNAT family N-acetyltransferase [Clostridia bacterium]|nr:GNAT family N-acetyltransferase [Clostridia bacterium]